MKKPTITGDEDVKAGFHQVVGRRLTFVRPRVISADLFAAYRNMGVDECREADANEWVEATASDIEDEAR